MHDLDTFQSPEILPESHGIGMFVVKDRPCQIAICSIITELFAIHSASDLQFNPNWHSLSANLPTEDREDIVHMLVNSEVAYIANGTYQYGATVNDRGYEFWQSQYARYKGSFFYDALLRSVSGQYYGVYIFGEIPQVQITKAVKKLKGTTKLVLGMDTSNPIIVQQGKGIRGLFPVESFFISDEIVNRVIQISPIVGHQLAEFIKANRAALSFLDVPHEYQPYIFEVLSPRMQESIAGSSIHTPDNLSDILKSLIAQIEVGPDNATVVSNFLSQASNDFNSAVAILKFLSTK